MKFSMKQSSLFLCCFILASFAFFASCKKENNSTVTIEEATQTLKTIQTLNNSFNNAMNGNTKAQNKLKSDDNEVVTRGDSCGSITVTPIDWFVFPKTVTYDFGTGCTDRDGKVKSGKLILKIGKVWEPNSVVEVTYQNYVEDSIKLNGTFSLTNNSTATAANFTFQANNISVTGKDGKTLSYNIRQVYKQTGGLNNWNWFDDVFDITGEATATLPDGRKLDWAINTPLKKVNNCYWVQAGVGTLKIDNSTIAVDYGNNTCDNKATMTIDGVSFEIRL